MRVVVGSLAIANFQELLGGEAAGASGRAAELLSRKGRRRRKPEAPGREGVKPACDEKDFSRRGRVLKISTRMCRLIAQLKTRLSSPTARHHALESSLRLKSRSDRGSWRQPELKCAEAATRAPTLQAEHRARNHPNQPRTRATPEQAMECCIGEYFSPSYRVARGRFLEAASAAGFELEALRLPEKM